MDGGTYEIFITHVGEEGPLLKIWGQTERTVPTAIERLIGQCTPKFNQGIGAPLPSQLHIGQLCCAQYSDGTYYRARITSLDKIARSEVCVQFADYGNQEVISLNNIRLLDGMVTPLATYADQATHFYLANVAPITGRWTTENLKFVKDVTCYMDLKFSSVGKVGSSHFIQVRLQNGTDLGDLMASRRIVVGMLLDTQFGILHSIQNKLQLPQMQLWPMFDPEVPPPLPIAQMMVTQSTARAVEENVLERFSPQVTAAPAKPVQHTVGRPPSSRLVYPGRDTYGAPLVSPAARPPNTSPPVVEVAGFEVRRLEPNKTYNVRVVAVEDGPMSFIVSLLDMEDDLSKMLVAINSQQPTALKAPPMTGTICLGRGRDRTLLRAVVIHAAHACTLYFVDFGTTEEVPFDDIFAIPPQYVTQPKPVCLRITHSGLVKDEITKEIKDHFASLVTGKCFTLYTTVAEDHHLKQCGILFDEGKSIMNRIVTELKRRENVVLDRVPTPKVGATKSVTVQHIENMQKFFIVFQDYAQSLELLMLEISKHCQSSDADVKLAVARESVAEGQVYCARYVTDGQWYRVQVLCVLPGGAVQVKYVDYGNSETVDVRDLRLATPELVSSLKAQAVECCLDGFELDEGDDRVVDRFSELVVEKTLIMYVAKHMTNGVPVVNLHDLKAKPLLSICSELEKFVSEGTKTAADVKVVNLQPNRPAQSVEDSKHRSGAREVTDWRARPAAPDVGKMDTWEGSRESKTAAEGFPPTTVRSGDVKAAQLVFTVNPEDFYVQITPDTALVDLMSDISALYSKGGHPLARPTRGSLCVARFADDGEWYRAVVLSADSRSARVSFVDFGNDDEVPLADVREIDQAFTRLPMQAVHCCLSGSLPKGAEWSTEEIAEFTEMIDGKPLEVKFGTERNGVFSVHVTDGETGDKINDKFCAFVDNKPSAAGGQQGFNKQANVNHSNSYNKTERSYDRSERNHEKPERNFEKPERSYDKQERNYDKPERSYDKQERNYDKPERSYDRPDRNHEKPERNYDRSERSYNKSDKPERSYDKPDRFDGPSTRPAPARRQEPARVQEFARPDERLSVVEIPAADCQEVGVTWFISPEEFYVSQASTAKDFDVLMREMQPAYRSTQPISDSLEIGAPCVAVFAEDKSFCRAEVMATPNAYAHAVRFVDYGNCDLISKKDLFPIESKFLRLPKVAVQCSLLDVKPAEGEWPKASDEIDALFRNEKYQCTFHELVEGKYLVSLMHGAIDVAAALVEKGLAVRPLPPAPAAPTVPEEPMARSLLIGQTLRANVTYVEGLAKFYVHFAGNRVDEIQAAVDAYVTEPKNKRAFPATEVRVDRMCIASADGTQWYRANIVDCTGTAGIYVTFLDYGDGDEVSADKMLSMPEALAVLPAQAVECALVGCVEADVPPDVEDAFKTALEGNDVIISVKDFVEGSLCVHVFGLDGIAQPLVASIGNCPASTSALCALPMLTQHVGVVVSHADDVHNVWLQKAKELDKLAELLGELYAFYEEAKSGEPIEAPHAGTLCAGRAADEQWYRAEVLDTQDGSVNVRFVDYGNTEEIPTENVRELDARFLTAHAFAVHVRLPVTHAELELDLLAMTAEVVYVAAFSKRVDVRWIAELFHERETFSDSLVEIGFQLEPDYPFEESRNRLTRSPKLVPGLSLPVFVSHVAGPDSIWLHLESNVDAVERLQEQLQAVAEGLEDLTVPVVGDIAAAVFSEDDLWYRAEVLVANDSAITVRFLDYGNTDLVNILTKPLKRLPRKLANVEPLATRCGLDVSPIDREFGSEVTEKIRELVASDENVMTATVVKEGNVIDLTVNGKSLYEVLTEEALVIAYYDPNTVFISHLVSPTEFYVQYQSATFQLEAMTERMTEAGDFEPLAHSAVGALCAAKFDEDGAWYRAKIAGTSGEGTQVFFVDFGNSATSTELRALPEDLLVVPPVAKRCSLVNASRYTPAAAERFVEISSEASFVMEIVAFTDPVQVELVTEGKKVSEILEKIGTMDLGEKVVETGGVGAVAEPESNGDDGSAAVIDEKIEVKDEKDLNLKVSELIEKDADGDDVDALIVAAPELEVASIDENTKVKDEKDVNLKVSEQVEKDDDEDADTFIVSAPKLEVTTINESTEVIDDGEVLIVSAPKLEDFNSIGATQTDGVLAKEGNNAKGTTFNPEVDGIYENTEVIDDGEALIVSAPKLEDFNSIGATQTDGVLAKEGNNAKGTTFNPEVDGIYENTEVKDDGEVLIVSAPKLEDFNSIGATQTNGVLATESGNAKGTVSDLEVEDIYENTEVKDDGEVLIVSAPKLEDFNSVGATQTDGVLATEGNNAKGTTFNPEVDGIYESTEVKDDCEALIVSAPKLEDSATNVALEANAMPVKEGDNAKWTTFDLKVQGIYENTEVQDDSEALVLSAPKLEDSATNVALEANAMPIKEGDNAKWTTFDLKVQGIYENTEVIDDGEALVVSAPNLEDSATNVAPQTDNVDSVLAKDDAKLFAGLSKVVLPALPLESVPEDVELEMSTSKYVPSSELETVEEAVCEDDDQDVAVGVEESKIGRSKTQHDNQIVPGAICRGVSVTPMVERLAHAERIVPGSVSCSAGGTVSDVELEGDVNGKH